MFAAGSALLVAAVFAVALAGAFVFTASLALPPHAAAKTQHAKIEIKRVLMADASTQVLA
jgi:hypothetical protein